MKENSHRDSIKFYPMPTDDQALDKMMNETEENFKKGKYLSAKEARQKIKELGKENKAKRIHQPTTPFTTL